MAKRKTSSIIGGIAITVVAGIILFVLQQGYFQITSGPELFVKDSVLVSQAWKDSNIPIKFTIANEGTKAAQNCLLYFDDGLLENSEHKVSRNFSVLAGKIEDVTIQTGKYDSFGVKKISYGIECENYKGFEYTTSITIEDPWK